MEFYHSNKKVTVEYVHMGTGAKRGQRHQISLELEVQAVARDLTWVLGTKL